MRQVKLIKMVRDQQGQFVPTVPLMVYPTVSKFGQGEERFQWQLLAVVNGQIVKLCYLTDNQLLDFAHKIIDAVKEKQIALSLMGEQFVEQRINQLYSQKQVAHNQNTVNTTVNTANITPTPVTTTVSNTVTTANTAVPVTHTVTTANAVGTGIQPVKPVTPIPKPANLPDIDTV